MKYQALNALLAYAALTAPILTNYNQPVFAQETAEKNENLIITDSFKIMDENGQEIKEWDLAKSYTVKLVLTSKTLLTDDVLIVIEEGTDDTPAVVEPGLKVYLKKGGFTAESNTVKLLSKEGELLKTVVIFKNVKADGTSKDFGWKVDLEGQPTHLGSGNETISMVQKEEPPTTDPNKDPDQTDDNNKDSDRGSEVSSGGFTYDGGSYYGGAVSEQETVKSPAPNLIVKKYSFGSENVKTGSTFDLKIDFRNTSKLLTAENILMQIEPAEGLTVADSSYSKYFESLAPLGELSQTIKMKALGTDTTTSPTVTITFTYEYVDQGSRIEKTNTEKIAIPLVQPDRFEISEAEKPEDMMVGQETNLSFPYVNKGKGTIYNAAIRVEGDMNALQKIVNVGNIDSGKNGSFDVFLTPEKSGKHNFKIVITYENSMGEETKKEYPFEVDVQEAMIPETPDEMNETEPKSSPLGWILALVALAAAVIGFILFKKKKKKKSVKNEEEDKDWFEDEKTEFKDDDEL